MVAGLESPSAAANDGRLRGPVLLINPPSPRGFTANREGFGGLGTLTAGRRGFLYPDAALAEAAARLRSLRVPVRAGDLAMQPWRGPVRLFRRLPELDGGHPAILHVAVVSLDHDLAWAKQTLGEWSAPLVVQGTALAEFRSEILAALPRATIVSSGRGVPAADALLARFGATRLPLENELELPAFVLLPLGRARGVPLWSGYGCTSACRYCPYVVDMNRQYLPNAVELVTRRFAALVKAFRPKRVVLRDPNLGQDLERSLSLFEALSRLPARDRVPFEAESRPDWLPLSWLDAFRRAGGVELKLGIESFDPEFLVSSGRVPDTGAASGYRQRCLELVNAAAKMGIGLRLFLMRGLGSSADGALPSVVSELNPFGEVVIKDLLPANPRELWRRMHRGGSSA